MLDMVWRGMGWRRKQVAGIVACGLIMVAMSIPTAARGDEPSTTEPVKADSPAPTTPAPTSSAPPAATTPAAAPAETKSGKPSFAVALKDARKIDGLIPLWKKDDKVFAEIPDALLGKELFVLISIAKGIGDRSILGGMSVGFGDDWVWQFRKVDDTIHVVRKNVRFFADKGSPEEKAVGLAYTDSVLFSVPIVTTGPEAGMPLIEAATGVWGL